MAGRTPPRFVPTLTEVVQSTPARSSTVGRIADDQLVHRIMQRIDLTLDGRLREAIGRVVLEHSRQLAPALRAEIEAMVTQAVSDVLSEELAGRGGPGPSGG